MDNRGANSGINGWAEVIAGFAQKKGKVRTEKQSTIRSIIITVIFAVVLYYLYLPAINIKDHRLYLYVLAVLLVYMVTWLRGSGNFDPSMGLKDFAAILWKKARVVFGLFVLVCAAAIIFAAISNQVVAARRYHELLGVQDGDFVTDVYSISYSEIPTLDASSASQLGSRALGELSDIVSQFEVAEDYTQINYNTRPVRVASLRYGNIIKWFNNRREGIPGYVLVDMITQAASVVRLEDGIRISPSERFSRDLTRYLRFQYPTYIFDTPHLEIDDDGTPYWICPRLDKTIGIFGGTDVIGAVLLNPITGECQYYDEVPQWVDQVYSADLIMRQYDFYGKYGKGFINSILGQSGVTMTTEGSNYIALNDDVYMYTGITSVGSDNSNVAFILCNQRTKDTRYYPIVGATEQSAMLSAQGIVQDLGYTATFPLLLNVADQPTFFTALKDNAELVKMYAMVNVSQYQIVATGASILECEANYVELLKARNVIEEDYIYSADSAAASDLMTETIEGAIEDIRSLVMNGTTYFYIKLEDESSYFEIDASTYPLIVIANVGDSIRIEYHADALADITPAERVELQ